MLTEKLGRELKIGDLVLYNNKMKDKYLEYALVVAENAIFTDGHSIYNKQVYLISSMCDEEKNIQQELYQQYQKSIKEKLSKESKKRKNSVKIKASELQENTLYESLSGDYSVYLGKWKYGGVDFNEDRFENTEGYLYLSLNFKDKKKLYKSNNTQLSINLVDYALEELYPLNSNIYRLCVGEYSGIYNFSLLKTPRLNVSKVCDVEINYLGGDSSKIAPYEYVKKNMRGSIIKNLENNNIYLERM